MAIIHCPGCSQRISSQAEACPHCDLALAEMSPEEQYRLVLRRWKRRVWRAANFTYLGMTLLVVGAIWWWFAQPQGWTLPPPPVAIGMAVVGVVLYAVARSWLFWLKLKRNRPAPPPG